MRETWVQSLGWEDFLEKGMATHSSILAWGSPWTEESGRLQSMGSQRTLKVIGKFRKKTVKVEIKGKKKLGDNVEGKHENHQGENGRLAGSSKRYSI